MPININDYVLLNTTQAKNDSQHSVNEVETKEKNNLQSDSVKLTNIATNLQALEQEILDSPVTDKQHIDRIQNDINNNRFKFNDQQVAEKILGLELSLNNIRH